MALRNRHTLRAARSVFVLVRLGKPADFFVGTASTSAAPGNRSSGGMQILAPFLPDAVGAGLELRRQSPGLLIRWSQVRIPHGLPRLPRKPTNFSSWAFLFLVAL